MELAELVAFGAVKEIDSDCPFAHLKSEGVKNDLDWDPAKLGRKMEAGVSTILYKEDGDKYVPATLKDRKKDKDSIRRLQVTELHGGEKDKSKHVVPVRYSGDSKVYHLPYSPNAHHIIPTNESLKAAKLMKFIEEGDSITGDIGYDTNGAENGVWLPTYTMTMRLMDAVKTGKESEDKLPAPKRRLGYSEFREKFKKDLWTRNAFPFSIMYHKKRQYHDHHTAYSSKVLEMLDNLSLFLTKLADMKKDCKECEKLRDEKKRNQPQHGLVVRLNGMSSRLRGYLACDVAGWRPPLFASKEAAEYYMLYNSSAVGDYYKEALGVP